MLKLLSDFVTDPWTVSKEAEQAIAIRFAGLDPRLILMKLSGSQMQRGTCPCYGAKPGSN